MWIFFSVFGALFQAAGFAVKKKSLQTQGINNVIGFISFTFAGVIFWLRAGKTAKVSPTFW